MVPTVLDGSESGILNARERTLVVVFDMKCLIKVLGVGVVH